MMIQIILTMIKWIKSGYKIIIIKQYCSFIFENDYECKRKYLKSSKCFKMLIVQQWLFSKVGSCLSFLLSPLYFLFSSDDIEYIRISLVVQWLRIHPEMQKTWVQSLVGEPRFPHAAEQTTTCVPQLLSPWTTTRESVGHTKKCHTLQLRPDAANKYN